MTDIGKKIRPAVKAIIEKDDKLLVLNIENRNSSYWVLPGGKVEYGEAPLNSLERELEEELSVNAEIKEIVGMYHFFVGSEDEGDEIVLTTFEADIGDQQIDISSNPADENITKYRWMTTDKLIEKTSNQSLAKLIAKYRNKK